MTEIHLHNTSEKISRIRYV